MTAKTDLTMKQRIQMLITEKINAENAILNDINKDTAELGSTVVSLNDVSRTMAHTVSENHASTIRALQRELEILLTPELQSDCKNMFSSIDLSINFKNTLSVVLSPVMGGYKVEIDGKKATLVTPFSPIGKRLPDANVNDEFEINANKYKVIAINGKNALTR